MKIQNAYAMMPADWQQEMARCIRSTEELLAILDISAERAPPHLVGKQDFPLRVPRGYVARMRKGDPNDPLLRQVLPAQAEKQLHPAFSDDPVGDLGAIRGPGILQKYHGRILLMTTGACAIHCRYCFRRHFPYSDHSASANEWDQITETIGSDPGIHELILSGGDPLTLSNQRLTSLTTRLTNIPHLKRLRIHSRMPVVLPERVDHGLLDWLKNIDLKPIVVIHINHPNEIDDAVRKALQSLSRTGATLLNQSVLLHGINDSSKVLIELSEKLFDAGVIPYYLHLLDKVAGAVHFDVAEAVALQIYRDIEASLPGYLVPRLVREIAGATGKTPLTTAFTITNA